MALPSETDVLICGAGPSGLATALSILHHRPETRVVVVDALEQGQNESRALVVHAGTMEALDTIGCSKAIASAGILCQSGYFQNASRPIARFDFSVLSKWTRFNYANLIPQHHTEETLAHLLSNKGGEIFRPYKVTDIQLLEGAPGFSVTFQNERSLKTKYLVGADGGRSTVRKFSGIGFSDPKLGWSLFLRLTYRPLLRFVVTDVTFTTTLPVGMYGKVHGTTGTAGFLLFVPLRRHLPKEGDDAVLQPSEYTYRLAFYVLEEEESRARNISNDIPYLQGKIDASLRYFSPDGDAEKSILASNTPTLKEVIWTSTFIVRYALADQMYKHYDNGGELLLAGDAAHIHSPVGGQGMNMGIVDGVALGGAIASHLQFGPLDSNPLETYSKDRRKIALKIINQTKSGTSFAVITNPIACWIRERVVGTLGKIAWFREQAARTASGLQYIHAKS